MPTLLPSAEQMFLDGDGAPLAGGLVYFYVPNTTVPKDTWQDAAGTIKNQNPVILDADGRAIIYGTGSYRQVLKDAAGDVIWDQITADTSSSATSWAGTSSGTGTNIILTAPNFASVDGQAIDFILGVTLDGAAQATVNGTPIPLKIDSLYGQVQTSSGDAIAGNRYRVTYDGNAGFLHLSPVVDRAYVDARDAVILSQADGYAAAQAVAAQITAYNLATAYAANGDAATLSAAETYAAGQAASQASAAQTAAYNAAVAYASSGDASTLSAAESYAYTQDATVLSSANGYAYSQAQAAQSAAAADATSKANAAQSAAQSFASGAASSAQSNATSYSDSQLASAQSSNASTYVRGVRLSGSYTAALTGVQPGSVCTGSGGGSQANYAYLQTNVNGQWTTVASN